MKKIALMQNNKPNIKLDSFTGRLKLFCPLFLITSFIFIGYPAFADTVKNITTIKEYGKDLDWSTSRNLIASCRIGLDGYYDVFVMRPDGSEEKNLTHNKPGCPQKHNGNVMWHPSGDFIVFTAQNEDTPNSKIVDSMAIPGSGTNCNLWVMKSDGSRFWQLTNYSTNERPIKAKGVIHPQFSHDGKKLFWAEKIGSEKSSFDNSKEGKAAFLKRRLAERNKERSSGDAKIYPWGEWELKVADFIYAPDNPRIRNIRTYRLGEQHAFYESHCFSADGKKVLFSGNLIEGQPGTGLDIYEMDLETEELRRLTSSFEDWDEHAHFSPDGKKIAWMSSTGFDIEFESSAGHGWAKDLKTELWIMDRDGQNKQRLTHFNDPGYPEYMGGRQCIVSDSTFSPDGSKIAVLVGYKKENGKLGAKIILVEFEQSA
jgi:Tol biopolymer transport system component